jgi:cytochrome c556
VLRDASLQALSAIDSKNATALLEAGGTIDAACEACHMTFWYPDDSNLGRSTHKQ